MPPERLTHLKRAALNCLCNESVKGDNSLGTVQEIECKICHEGSF